MIKRERNHTLRALLRLERQDLARRDRVSFAAVRRLEAENAGAGVAPGTLNTVQHGRRAAEADCVRRRRSRTPEEKEALIREIMAIADRVAALHPGNPGFSEEDLYDENGLPA